jgi:type IV pilus assembly protein PilM
MFGLGKAKKFLGIDIGNSSIKIVELSRKGNGIILENYGEVDTSLTQGRPFKSIKKDTIILSDQNIARAIFSICAEMRTNTKEINFSIPDFCTFFTTFQMPAMNENELAEAIRYEVRPYIPLPLSEITLDWVVTNGQVGKTPIEVLVVAIPNDIIQQYQNIARISNLRLKSLEPETFSLARVIAKIGEKGIVAIIDLGARSTTCSIVDGTVLKTSHSFNIASNELTERLSTSLGIGYAKAEEMKRKYGLTIGNHPELNGSQDIRSILTPSIDMIIEETKKVFRTFYSEKGKEVEKVFLTGGSAWLPGLKEYIFVELKKEIQVLNPFVNISYQPTLKEALEKRGPFYAVPVGLALKGIE